MIQVGYVWCCLPGSNGFQVSFELRRTSTIEVPERFQYGAKYRYVHLTGLPLSGWHSQRWNAPEPGDSNRLFMKLKISKLGFESNEQTRESGDDR